MTLTSILRPLLCLATLSLASTSSFAQSRTSGVIAGLEVVVQTPHGTARYAVRADGTFSLGSLANGGYRIRFSYMKNILPTQFHTKNTSRIVVIRDGAKTSAILWDTKSNTLYTLNNMQTKPDSDLEIEIGSAEEISGQILMPAEDERRSFRE
ncbi:MAG: hypothetical protein FJW39_16955 [Acidobacteria bacterium]|nr:hypothetical protein [Acidobacteriota bacterium]